jgi:hypothetical protein
MHEKTREEWAAERVALLEGVREFAAVLKHAPFQNKGGLRGVSAFALWWFLRRLQPEVVIESGVWKGFSTWLIEQAVPDAEVFCFDPVIPLQSYLSLTMGRKYRSRRAHYSGHDFSCAAIPELIAGRKAVTFFDDHQNKWPRLLQSRAYGIRELIFDDNSRQVATHRTFEEEPRETLAREIEQYEVFPALWPVDFRIGGMHILEPGLDFPVTRELKQIYKERQWHSSVTYVRLRPAAQ